MMTECGCSSMSVAGYGMHALAISHGDRDGEL